MRHIYAFRTGFRVQLSHKDVIYSGPLRATQAAACEDLDRVQAYASRGEQVKFLGVLQKEAGNGCARGAFGAREAVAPAAEHVVEEPKAVEAPAMDVGEQQEPPGRGEVAEESEAKGAEEKENVGSRVCKRRGDDVMATQAAGEPQEASVMGQEAAYEHLGEEPEEAGAPADEDAREEPEARGPHLLFVFKRK